MAKPFLLILILFFVVNSFSMWRESNARMAEKDEQLERSKQETQRLEALLKKRDET